MGQGTDILFLNPDNGIDPIGMYKLKYVHLWEIAEFFGQRQKSRYLSPFRSRSGKATVRELTELGSI